MEDVLRQSKRCIRFEDGKDATVTYKIVRNRVNIGENLAVETYGMALYQVENNDNGEKICISKEIRDITISEKKITKLWENMVGGQVTVATFGEIVEDFIESI